MSQADAIRAPSQAELPGTPDEASVGVVDAPEHSAPTTASDGLGRLVRRGLSWSIASTLVLRFANLALGIVLARILVPEVFGVFAIALTVQGVLITLADLGLSADLVRTEDPEGRAPTVATIALVSSAVLAVSMAVSSPWVAHALGAPQSSGVIAAMSVSLLLAGLGVVPLAILQRRFEQKKLFATSATDFVVALTATLALVELGMGPMALAVGRITAQGAAIVLQYVFARRRPTFGFDRHIASGALRYTLPLAFANLVSWALISVDTVVVSRAAGVTALGFYVLAFNVSSWPMSAIGYGIRAVSFAAYARVLERSHQSGRDRSLAIGAGIAWAAGLLVGGLLALLGEALIEVLYGTAWGPAAPALAGLGVFGAFRVLFDLMATYLMAKGLSRAVLVVQLIWLLALVPTMMLAVDRWGLAGAGWAHVTISLVVVLPTYIVVVHRSGADLGALLSVLWQPLLAATIGAAGVLVVREAAASPWAILVVGASVGTSLYGIALLKWARRLRLMLSAVDAAA